MEFLEVINSRYSCRKFTNEKIKETELKVLLEAARIAPSAVNFFPTKIMIIENEELLEKLKSATKYTFNAKTVLCILHDKRISWHRRNDNKDHGIIDSTICATHIMLACTSIGLGSTYVCAFKEELLREILEIGDEYEVNCLLPIGYPAETKNITKRKELDEIVIRKE